MVIPTHRRPGRCRRLLEALAIQSLSADEFEVIVVDDASGDETKEVLAELAAEVPYRLVAVTLDANSGPAVARNVGWRRAAASLVAFIDDDCVPARSWLEDGLMGFASGSRVGVVQGPAVPPSGYDPEKWPRWHHRQEIRSPSPFFEACNVFYHRQALEDAGGFDEAIGWWGEDTALGYEVLAQGWQSAWAPGAEVVHDVTERGWSWWARMALYESHLVVLAARYPLFRERAFWRRWAFRQENFWFVLAVLAATAALRWRPAMLLTAPYLWKTRQSPRDPKAVFHWAEVVGVDAARAAGHLAGSAQCRTLVL